MNKQEVIDEIENAIPDFLLNDFQRGKETGLSYALELVEQLNDPEKPVVPRFVADFYESIKDDLEDGVYELCVQFYEDESEPSTNLYRWFNRDDSKPIETLVKMRLYGYKVAEYKVTLKSNGFSLGIFQGNGPVKTIFTRDELAEYGFNNLDKYEVTEVDDE